MLEERIYEENSGLWCRRCFHFMLTWLYGKCMPAGLPRKGGGGELATKQDLPGREGLHTDSEVGTC
jgi:hypothetical protein